MTRSHRDLKAIPLDQFASDIHQVCGDFTVEPMCGRTNLNGAVDLVSTCGFDAARVNQNAQSISRTERDIRHDPGDHYFLILQESGEAHMGHDTNMKRLVPGDMLLVDSTRPSTFYYGGQQSCQLSLHLPREQQEQRFGARVRGGIHISHSDPLGQAMRSIVKSVMTVGSYNQMHSTEAFYSVLGAYLINQAHGNASPQDGNQLLVNRALDVMSKNFVNPDFTVSHVADKLHVSQRQLQRAFQSAGITLRDKLQQIRLEAAANLMRKNALNTHLSVAQFAFEAGFADVSTFHRQFKAAYQKAPGTQLREWRAMQ